MTEESTASSLPGRKAALLSELFEEQFTKMQSIYEEMWHNMQEFFISM